LSRRLARLVLGLVLLVVGSIVAIAAVGSGLEAASHLGSTVGGTGGPGPGAGGTLPVLGKAVQLPAAADHPAIVVRADKVVRLRSTASAHPLPAGLHLVGVRYSIQNLGDRLWGPTPNYLQLSLLTSDGLSAPRAASPAPRGRRLLPAVFNLGGGRTRRGFVVFSIRDGAKPVRVSAGLGYGAGGTATWLVP
jgi:hypothetical protein